MSYKKGKVVKAVTNGPFHNKETWGGVLPKQDEVADASGFVVHIARSMKCRALETSHPYGGFSVDFVPLWRRVLSFFRIPIGILTIRADIDGHLVIRHNRGVVRIVGDISTPPTSSHVLLSGKGRCIIEGNVGSHVLCKKAPNG
jgi:hypothetical protein